MKERPEGQVCMFWHKHELTCSTSLRNVPAQRQLLKPQRVLQVFHACGLLSKGSGMDRFDLQAYVFHRSTGEVGVPARMKPSLALKASLYVHK